MDMSGYVVHLWELFGIGASREDGEGAIELLGEHDAREFMREGGGAERHLLMSALAQVLRETAGIAAEEDEFVGAAVSEFAEPFGEGFGGQIFSRGVQEDDACGTV